MEANYWNQLSFSSKRVLMWASALAYLREEENQSPSPSPEIDTFDIFVGMLLEHPKDAEPRLLLEHFQLSPGQVLPPDYPPLSQEMIERNMRKVTQESAMNLDGEADNVVASGIDMGLRTSSSEVAEFRALFGAMLEMTNPVSHALNEIFNKIGVPFDEIVKTNYDYVEKYSPKQSYAEILNDRFPYNPKPIDIPNYKADHGQEHKLADDMVGIRSEVDAFAYLLASRGLMPPLAVGLFGDWGSGKSFFMESLRKRIEQLTQDKKLADKPQSEVPFWKRIIQIEFNAWHYMEGELWASLVDHIFNQLGMEDETPDLVKKRRDHWLKKIDETRANLISLETKRKNIENNLLDKQDEANLLKLNKQVKQEKLERLKTQATKEIVLKESLNEVQEAVKPYFKSTDSLTADEALKKINEAKTELKRSWVIIEKLWSDKLWRIAIITALVLIPALVLLLPYIDVPEIVAKFSGISATLAAVFTFIGKATQIMKSINDKLQEAEEKVNHEIHKQLQGINKEITKSEEEIKKIEDNLNGIATDQQKLNKELKESEKELENVTPTRVLTDFVAERVGSGDYRKLLGIPALIQQDFRQLSKLITEQNKVILNDTTGKLEKNQETFNRIILYIDDLDRCPDEHVVKVLQAVHLLLAFDLFVVVVAVDSRWLSHALTQHFKALALDKNGNNGNTATPDDYLEKIFQIPFWIQPLGDSARRNIVQGLLRGHLTGESEVNEQGADVDKPKVGDDQQKVLAQLEPTNAPPTLQTAALSITRAELNFLDELAPILGTTPRSTKRFVNLYQLVRIIYHLNPDSDVNESPKNHELFAFILALGEGLPKLGPILLNEAVKAEAHDNFESILLKSKTKVDVQELKRLENWLTDHFEWKQIPAKKITDAFNKIDRFLFRVGTIDEMKGS